MVSFAHHAAAAWDAPCAPPRCVPRSLTTPHGSREDWSQVVCHRRCWLAVHEKHGQRCLRCGKLDGRIDVTHPLPAGDRHRDGKSADSTSIGHCALQCRHRHECILPISDIRRRSQSLGETDTSAHDPAIKDNDDTFHAFVVCVLGYIVGSTRPSPSSL